MYEFVVAYLKRGIGPQTVGESSGSLDGGARLTQYLMEETGDIPLGWSLLWLICRSPAALSNWIRRWIFAQPIISNWMGTSEILQFVFFRMRTANPHASNLSQIDNHRVPLSSSLLSGKLPEKQGFQFSSPHPYQHLYFLSCVVRTISNLRRHPLSTSTLYHLTTRPTSSIITIQNLLSASQGSSQYCMYSELVFQCIHSSSSSILTSLRCRRISALQGPNQHSTSHCLILQTTRPSSLLTVHRQHLLSLLADLASWVAKDQALLPSNFLKLVPSAGPSPLCASS